MSLTTSKASVLWKRQMPDFTVYTRTERRRVYWVNTKTPVGIGSSLTALPLSQDFGGIILTGICINKSSDLCLSLSP